MTLSNKIALQLEALAKLYARCTVPLFKLDSNGDPIAEGTGFIVWYRPKKRLFLVSARHVLEQPDGAELYYYIMPNFNTMRRIVEQPLVINDGPFKPIDIGIVELPADNKNIPLNATKVSDEDFKPKRLPRWGKNKVYVVTGYPYSTSKRDFSKMVITSQPMAFMGPSKLLRGYINHPVKPERHILIHHNPDEAYDPYNKKTDPIALQGLSGSPVFLLDKGINNTEIVGVATDTFADDLYFKATDIGFVLKLIRQACRT